MTPSWFSVTKTSVSYPAYNFSVSKLDKTESMLIVRLNGIQFVRHTPTKTNCEWRTRWLRLTSVCTPPGKGFKETPLSSGLTLKTQWRETRTYLFYHGKSCTWQQLPSSEDTPRPARYPFRRAECFLHLHGNGRCSSEREQGPGRKTGCVSPLLFFCKYNDRC